MAPFQRLMKALATPFEATDPDLARPPSEDEIVPANFRTLAAIRAFVQRKKDA